MIRHPRGLGHPWNGRGGLARFLLPGRNRTITFGDMDRSRLTLEQRAEVIRRSDHLRDISATSVASNVLEWITETDSLRRSSGSLQGGVRGKMKVNLASVKCGVDELLLRASSEGEGDS